MTGIQSIQKDILDYLEIFPDRRDTYRNLIRAIHPERFGTTLWTAALTGLLNSGVIGIIGRGVKTDPKIIFIRGNFDTSKIAAITTEVLTQTPTLEKLLIRHLALLRDQYLRSL